MDKRSAVAVIVLSSLILTGCSIGYLARSAYQGSAILLNRVSISDAISSSDATEIEKEKLPLVLEARAYAERRGFGGGKIFSKYSRLNTETLTWVVVGCKEDAFNLYTWWFPIVGTVPYKGFFEKEDAVLLAADLQRQGYETSVRGADALSTLGWFNDPVVTPMLRHNEFSLVTTVLHELVHAKLWVPGEVEFNESMAQFLAVKETERFFSEKGRGKEAKEFREKVFSYADATDKLFSELDALYKTDVPKEEKLTKKIELFKKYNRTPNNAELMQAVIYSRRYGEFEKIYNEVGEDAGKFLDIGVRP